MEHRILRFTPDSKQLYYATDGAGEFAQAWSVDLARGQHEPRIQADWDVLGVDFSENGKIRVSWVNADARTEVAIVDTATGSRSRSPACPRRTSPTWPSIAPRSRSRSRCPRTAARR